jgi:hypothetical protein
MAGIKHVQIEELKSPIMYYKCLAWTITLAFSNYKWSSLVLPFKLKTVWCLGKVSVWILDGSSKQMDVALLLSLFVYLLFTLCICFFRCQQPCPRCQSSSNQKTGRHKAPAICKPKSAKISDSLQCLTKNNCLFRCWFSVSLAKKTIQMY